MFYWYTLLISRFGTSGPYKLRVSTGHPIMDATEVLAGCRVVPVVVIEEESSAVELAATLLEAGIGAIEVTLRSAAALGAIKLIAQQVPGIVVGAGSIRQVAHFQEIAQAGAKFAVSPGGSEALLAQAKKDRMPFVPGAATASENINLLEQGYSLQKFFPAELNGGVKMIKALSAPLPEVRFFPTGGVTPKLAPEYLQLNSVQCVGGTWIATSDLVARGDFEAIGKLAQEASAL